jgi:hypothetical protein
MGCWRHQLVQQETPSQRHKVCHTGATHGDILVKRMLIYEKAKAKHPERWTATCRNWDIPAVVTLNHTRPGKDHAILKLGKAA